MKRLAKWRVEIRDKAKQLSPMIVVRDVEFSYFFDALHIDSQTYEEKVMVDFLTLGAD